MKWTGLNELREKYLTFFEEKEHLRLPSAPLVPKEDKSLLLINSGMAPLKKYFLGLEPPPSKRVTSCQKCIRTPDIEGVGKTDRHGTYFEMLGNFSFGDYFKKEAIAWAWEFFTEVLEIPTDLLWATVYHEDDEAFAIWTKDVGVAPERVIRLGKEDNFWEIGSGPCGPSSEIFFDRGEEHGCGPNCGIGKCECDRYMEIWNLVFTQFNSDGQGNYTPLEHTNIDTGLGLERLACVLQNVANLFEVDTMTAIMQAISTKAEVTYKENEEADISLRVVTDHIRSSVFLVGDGVIPQNEGRGYVLRRLIRRAARHGRLLGITEPFLFEVAEVVIAENKIAYPELAENSEYIKKIIYAEEERFSYTIEQGMDMLASILEDISTEKIRKGARIIKGAEIFRLYDTFGFPIDLTREIAQDQGVELDEAGFTKHMEAQRQRARKAHQEQSSVSWEEDVLAGLDIEDTFVGYSQLKTETLVLAIVEEGELVDEVGEGKTATFIVAETPFYAESGGQAGDAGMLSVGKNMVKITDTVKSPSGHFLHQGEVKSGFIHRGDTASLFIDMQRRRSIMRNHTATHLLQAALKEVLGSHVHQSGSLVSPDILRFDFTHFSAVSSEELKKIEKYVNDAILEATSVTVEEMPLEEAKSRGATALFGDKYEANVRVVSISAVSSELCGGTHVRNTAEISLFKITTEGSVAAGVRRIEAVTGQGVLDYMTAQENILINAARVLRATSPKEVHARGLAVMEHVTSLQEKIELLETMLAQGQTASLEEETESIGSIQFVAISVDGPIEPLQKRADVMKNNNPDIVGAFTATQDDKTSILVFAGKDAVAKGIHAGQLVKEIAALTGGSGGGRPDHAMGGIADPSKLAAALETARGLVGAQLA